ncbi:TetR/AcrR family transcriptional regulator [Microbispora rosea]|uniref:TetR/AcrR family transcriptional regulator n=1 Tax=Microbispora rosea TaxID=58117 RepID=UPI0036A3F43C
MRARILAATGALLLDEGMAGVTIERVAELSGASKTTVYKWWPSKGALALHGYFHAVESALAFPDGGDVEVDLVAQLRSLARLLTGTPAGRVIAGIIGQAQTDPDLADVLLRHYSGPRRDLAVEVLRQAQERGQLRPDLDLDVTVDQLWGPFYHRLLLFPNMPITEEYATALVRNLLAGIRT